MKTNPAFRLLLKLLACLTLMACGSAQATITCALSATSVNLNYVNNQGANANASGSITVNCNRVSTDATIQSYWIGIDSGTRTGTSRRVFRHGGGIANADRLNVSIFKNGTTTNWTNTGNGRVSGTLNFGAALSASVTLTYDFRVPLRQTGNTAGIYDEIFTTSLQLTTAGPVGATATFTPTVSIIAQCFVGQVGGNTAPGAVSPSTLTLNYTAFSTTAQTATMGFTVDCTNGTTYGLTLSPTSGVLVGLPYTLSLTPPGTSVIGTGFADPYTVTGTIAPGLAGTCAAATCSATQPTTITITY